MSSVIKTYLTIALLLVAVLTFAGIITASYEVQNARDYHAAVVNEIEISNHAESVISACTDEASENGYTLSTTQYYTGTGDYDGSQITKVVLKYTYSIPFLGISTEKEIIGYAR